MKRSLFTLSFMLLTLSALAETEMAPQNEPTPGASVAPEMAITAPEAPSQVVAPVEPVKTSQTFEESLGLPPAGDAPVSDLIVGDSAQKPEAALAVPGTGTEPKKEAALKPAPQIAQQIVTAPTIVEAAEQAVEQSDEESCTTLCKRVCLKLKEEESEQLETQKPAAQAALPGFVEPKQ